ncbi:hypothetical protein [Thermococcus zilligii]|uniref:hypothetical protein n=1 Tax=Thermococcus zilligii TaxID=54076 RepID=UPI00029B1207|nr:hypothetical protein [Thermococcus zilligii]
MRWKPLVAILLGLLIVSETSGKSTEEKDDRQVAYIVIDGEIFKVYNNTKVALDDEGPSKYYANIRELPIHIAGMRLCEKISKDYAERGYVSQDDIDILIKLIEGVTKELSTAERQMLKKLILDDLDRNFQIERVRRQLISQNSTLEITSQSSSLPREVLETLPKIYQPWIDILYNPNSVPIQGLNPLVSVWWYVYQTSSGKVIEYNLVFADEDHPLIDGAYDVYRLWKYGRIEDIEYFLVLYSENTAKFPDSYSKDQNFLVIKPEHLTSNEQYSGKIYINTWNHMMSSQKDTNPYLPKKIWTSYPLIHGNRNDAHCYYSSQC